MHNRLTDPTLTVSGRYRVALAAPAIEAPLSDAQRRALEFYCDPESVLMRHALAVATPRYQGFRVPGVRK